MKARFLQYYTITDRGNVIDVHQTTRLGVPQRIIFNMVIIFALFPLLGASTADVNGQ